MPSNKGITWGHKSEPYQHHLLFNLRIVESAAYFKSRDAFVEDSLSLFCWISKEGNTAQIFPSWAAEIS